MALTKAQQAAAKKKADAAAKKNATAGAPAPAPAGAAAAPAGAPAFNFNVTALGALVAATHDAAMNNFMFMEADTVNPLVAMGYAETRSDMLGTTAEGTNGVASRSTPAGDEAFNAAQAAIAAAGPAAAAPAPAPAASPFGTPAAPPAAAAAPAPAPAPAAQAAAVAPAAPSAFKIVANVPIPAAKRFGKASTYPFDALQVGQGFFVPATKERENPAKSMASTVNSAKARYAVLDGKEADGVTDKYKNTREFILRNVQDGKDFGPEFAGVKGAGIWRTA